MKDRINRLAKGIVDLEVPELKLYPETLEGVVTAGEISKGEFILSSGNGIHLKGLVYSDHPKIHILKSAFGGVRTKVNFEIDARHLKDADQLKGCFYLVSNAGECKVPYSFCVRSYASAEIISTLHSAHDFAKLFLDEEGLALRIFDYADFVQAPFMKKPRIQTLYYGLKGSVDRRGAVLEFLKELHAAPKIEEVSLRGGTRKTVSVSEEGEVRAEEIQMQADMQQEKTMHLELLEDQELIEELAAYMIREGCTDSDAFILYQKAVDCGSRITRLYEYYLYALPDDFEGCMPKEIYLYFAYENNLSSAAKLSLYYNIIGNFSQDSDIYQKFEREIQQYAIENLLQSKINEKLARIYDRMIYPDMVDAHIASVLPAILNSYKVSTPDQRMAYVVLCCEELEGEELYPLKNGVAYIPMYFDNSVLLFQDAYGKRYADVVYSRTRVMDKQELEKRCFEIDPEQPMLKLASARRAAAAGIQNEKQLRLVEEVITQLRLSRTYSARLVHAVLDYHERMTGSGDQTLAQQEQIFLKGLDPDWLKREEQLSLIRTLIKLEQYEEAWADVLRCGVGALERSYLERLMRYVIQEGSETDEQVLLLYCWRLFEAGSKDGLILQYLCRHYNGSSADMLRILKRSAEQQIDTEDLTERLLAQMIFAREEQDLDYVYQQYWQLDHCEPVLISAYLTQKCIAYFIEQKQVGEAVFAQLEQKLLEYKEKDRIPTIYLLALSRYYADQKSLKRDQKKLLQDIMEVLLSQKLVFAYTRKLAKYMMLPEYVMDKVYLEYHGRKEEKPSLFVRILPDEAEFHEEEMPRVYQNIYVKPLVLFAGERAEYKIQEGSGAKPSVSGQLSASELYVKAKGDTYDMLNEMSGLMGSGQEAKLQECMLKYVRNQSMIDVLFAEI